MGMLGFGGGREPTGETTKAENQVYAPIYQQSQELGKLMLESANTNYKIYLRLLGYIEINRELKKIGEALMNDKGAASIMSFLDSLNTKDTFLTNLQDNDVVRIYHDIFTTIDLLLLENQEEWELPTDVSKWSQIRELIMNPIYFALRRGELGFEKDFFAKTHESRSVMTQGTQQQYKKSFLSI